MALATVTRHAPQPRRLPAPREFRDVRRTDDPARRIHAVLVAPSGVYVVTRPEPASPVVDAADLEESLEAAQAVSGLLAPRYRSTVRAVLCSQESEPRADIVGEVLVTTDPTLTHIVRSASVVLSTSEVDAVAGRLGACLEPVPDDAAPDRQPRGARRWPAWVGLAVVSVASGALVADHWTALSHLW